MLDKKNQTFRSFRCTLIYHQGCVLLEPFYLQGCVLLEPFYHQGCVLLEPFYHQRCVLLEPHNLCLLNLLQYLQEPYLTTYVIKLKYKNDYEYNRETKISVTRETRKINKVNEASERPMTRCKLRVKAKEFYFLLYSVALKTFLLLPVKVNLLVLL